MIELLHEYDSILINKGYYLLLVLGLINTVLEF